MTALRQDRGATPRRVDVALAGGTGRVGTAFATLLAERAPAVRASGLDLRLVGVARRSRWRWEPHGLPLAAPHDLLGGAPSSGTAEFLARSRAHGSAPLALVDCSASEELACGYAGLLEAGVAVVTPSKLGSAHSQERWNALHALAAGGAAPYRYSATVGAGMPVLSAVRRLRRRGDSLRALRAVLSGSLSAVLCAVQDGAPFSQAVADARERGCTEPHPGDDLSGEDVARKLLILLREAGIGVERADLRVESLVPAGLLRERDPEAFVEALPAFDEAWRARAEAAWSAGRRLAFVAEFDGGRARAEVRALPESDPLASLRPGENRVEILTAEGGAVPLSISGPGAGPEVTAANVLSDLLDAARGAWGARDAGAGRYEAPRERRVASA
ncbi:MAG: aspartate kinase [Candidatus Eisenbacteria bacterium]|nr:aspartate kinase [Candidatus Eisenbacteria bacterium]